MNFHGDGYAEYEMEYTGFRELSESKISLLSIRKGPWLKAKDLPAGLQNWLRYSW